MNGVFVTLLALLAASAQGKSLASNNSLQVQLYYESLSSDSGNFITSQLYPTFMELGSKRLNLELIPYGWSSELTLENGNLVFTCYYGYFDCYGNKVHACAIDLASSIEESLSFIYCSQLSSTPVNNTVLQQCATKVGLSWGKVEECISSGKGDTLLTAYGKKTAKVVLSRIPTIVLNGDHVIDRESDWSNFKEVVCQYVDCSD